MTSLALGTVSESNILPESWRRVRLEQICQVVSGSTPKTGVIEYWDGDIVWITPTDLGKLTDKRITASDRQITQAGYENCRAEIVPPGSVIMSSRAPIGHLGIADTPLCTNQGCKSFVPNQETDSLFLYYSLKQAVPLLKSLGSGATFAEISKTQLEKFEIIIPPTYSEQKHIGAILDEQIATVEKARTAAEEQLKSANALSEAYVREIFGSQRIKKWGERSLGEICDFQGGTQPPKSVFKYQPQQDYVRLLQIQDFKTEDYAVYVPDTPYLNKCDETDVLIGRYGASVGRILRGKAGAYNVAIIKAIPNLQEISKDYLFYVLRSSAFQSLIRDISGRAAQAGFTKRDVGSLKIPLPTLDEQALIVKHLNTHIALAEKVSKSLEKQLSTIEKLPATLLRQAFSGKL